MVTRRAACGFTLLELLIGIVVMGVVGAVTLPVMSAATDAFVESAKARRIADDAAFALERCTRLLRDIPPGAASGEIAIETATATAIRLSDGRGLERVGSELVERRSDGTLAVLCEGVEELEFVLLLDDGISSASGSPQLTHRIHLSLTVGPFNVRTVVFPRARVIPT